MDRSLPLRPKSVWRSKYFHNEILCMKSFGVSISGNEGAAYRIYSFVFLATTVFMYPILDFVEYFKHDFSEVADIVAPQVLAFMAMCKVAVVLRNRGAFANLLAKLEEEPFLPNPNRGGEKEQKIIDECLWITNLQRYIYWIPSSATVVGAVIYTYTKRLRSSDYHDWYFPYGPFTVLNLIPATNLKYCKIIFDVSWNWEMMKDYSAFELESSRNFSSSTEMDVSAIPWRYLKNFLKKAIEYHLAIIDLISEVEEICSELFLMVFIGTLAALCFSIYATTTVGNNSQAAARHMTEGICICLQVALICFWGEQVRHESQAVGTAVWESNFVGTDLRFQKMLVLIIRRSQNPVKVTAGKFAEICLITFVWIMRTSYSSFMVLQGVNTDTV